MCMDSVTLRPKHNGNSCQLRQGLPCWSEGCVKHRGPLQIQICKTEQHPCEIRKGIYLWLKILKAKAVGEKSRSQVQGTMEPRTTCRYSSSKVFGTLEASFRFWRMRCLGENWTKTILQSQNLGLQWGFEKNKFQDKHCALYLIVWFRWGRWCPLNNQWSNPAVAAWRNSQTSHKKLLFWEVVMHWLYGNTWLSAQWGNMLKRISTVEAINQIQLTQSIEIHQPRITPWSIVEEVVDHRLKAYLEQPSMAKSSQWSGVRMYPQKHSYDSNIYVSKNVVNIYSTHIKDYTLGLHNFCIFLFVRLAPFAPANRHPDPSLIRRHCQCKPKLLGRRGVTSK